MSTQQLFEGRALQCGAIVIAVVHQHPTFGFLAGDVGLAGVALGIERVELLIQALFTGFARVDGAAELSKHRFVHVRARWFFKPKKTRPFQRLPVMALAIADRDLYGLPACRKPPSVTVTRCSTPCHSRTSCVPATGRLFIPRRRGRAPSSPR